MDAFQDPFFRGCTRPAMLIGVPLMPLLLVSGGFLLVAAWTTYLISPYVGLFLALLYLPILLTMRAVTKQDDQRLRQLLMRLRQRLWLWHVRRHWGAYTYSPYRTKQRSRS